MDRMAEIRMNRLRQLYHRLEARGLTETQRRVIERELAMAEQFGDPDCAHLFTPPPVTRSLYSYNDPEIFAQGQPSPLLSMVAAQSLDHLHEDSSPNGQPRCRRRPRLCLAVRLVEVLEKARDKRSAFRGRSGDDEQGIEFF